MDMSDNVELVRRNVEVCARRMSTSSCDSRRMWKFLPLTGPLVESGGYRGHQGVRAYFEDAQELWDMLEPEEHE
jgi:hypothetical protein